jgi:hypothetical protein
MSKIEDEIIRLAEENVNKKLEKDREQEEQRLKSELDKVKELLLMIKKRMLYKTTSEDFFGNNKKYVLITEEVFFEDYNSEKNKVYRSNPIQIKDWEGKLDIRVNDIRYRHIGNLIKDFEETMQDKTDRVDRLSNNLRELQEDFESLKKQEQNIKKMVTDYQEMMVKSK